MSKTIKSSEINYREDLYPRFEADHKTIQKYSDSVEHLPPIKINQSNILIDGYHRWKAHELAGLKEIEAEIVETESEKEVKKLAYMLNSHHGVQLKNDEKRQYAQEMYGEMNVKELAALLSVSERTIKRWTKTQRKAEKERQKRLVTEYYLKAINTQDDISEILGVPRRTISDMIDKEINGENGQLSKFAKDFNLLLYNIWNTPKQDNAIKHFGAFPEVFMENLLYYHTEPLDIVYDPFAGGGTTVDVCKRMMRRYYASDKKVVPGREADIYEHDIKDGLPSDLPLPDLAFLDPPYWKQAEGKYSDDPDDLGNMSIEDFNLSMNNLLHELSDRGTKKIAIVIQPTQYSNGFQWQDHIFDFFSFLEGYKIEMRYILPYATQQYNAQMVEKAKEEKKCLALNRDLVVWRKND